MKPAFRVIATGICVPERVMTNQEIKATVNPRIDPDWVEANLGIRQRYVADSRLETSDLAAAAVARALDRAGLDAGTIDLLVLATSSPDRRAPATACFVQQKAGLANAVAFDVAAVCSGFLFGLTAAASMLATGPHKRALVVGADIFSRVTDWNRRDCVFFGDGAGAVLIESVTPKYDALYDAELYTDSRKRDAFFINGNDDRFVMDGPGVFEAASTAVPVCIDRVLSRNGLSSCDVDVVVPHQPSRSLLKEIAKSAGIPFERFQLSMGRYANTVGATIPIALHEAIEAGRLTQGKRVLFAAAGAGFTAGAAIHHWN